MLVLLTGEQKLLVLYSRKLGSADVTQEAMKDNENKLELQPILTESVYLPLYKV